jgi:primosomal protein N' (replication factor Y)
MVGVGRSAALAFEGLHTAASRVRPRLARAATLAEAQPETDMRPACLRLAIAGPMPQLFDYLPPAVPPAAVPSPGMRALAPFGRGHRLGMIIAVDQHPEVPAESLRALEAILDPVPLLSEADLDFLLWSARYYRCPPGEALFGALPGRLRRAQPVLGPSRSGWRLTAAGRLLSPAELGRAKRQVGLLACLQAADGPVADEALRAGGADPTGPLRALVGKGLIERCRLVTDATDGPELGEKGVVTAGPPLNAEQRAAVDVVAETIDEFGCFLLDGVTGSGKTEVYLQLIEATLARGRQVMVLVPEIGLTPQLFRRIARRITAPLALLHSGLPEAEREQAWRRASSGRARLLLGTRSAVFTPLPDLGLVIVDEEHDLSLKQQDGCRYSARDLAVRRGQLAGCPVLLGSATPSLETLHNARKGRYRHLRLRARAGEARPPRILVADIRAQPLETGLCHALLERMHREIEAGNQVLLFLNRRGFSPVLTCHDCGWISECVNCDARMTLHRGPAQLVCHHCGEARLQPVKCPYCDGPDLRPLGQGTERVEDTLRQRFPGIPLARIDRDTTRRKGELERLLAAARNGDSRLLLGTQMLAKGHHLPGVTLVAILDLDHGLYGADFRATERMAQLLIQVAGRAGRAERPGTVMLQTRHPNHPLLGRLLREGYPAFAEAALAERQAANLPPYSHQILIRADSPAEQAAMAFLHQARAAAGPLLQSGRWPGIQLWGPAPAPMERRARRIRAQLLVQGPARRTLQDMLSQWLPVLAELRAPRHLRWGVDVDPLDGY